MLQVKLEKPTPENSCLIELSQGKFAIVDKPVPEFIGEYKWRAVRWNFRWYAYASTLLNGSPCRQAMHRLIARTPHGQICHHYNKNSLDNRLGNLLNQTQHDHAELHGIRKWGRNLPMKTNRKRQ